MNEETNQTLPQIGDEMIFFTQGYEQFLHRNSHQLDFSRLAEKDKDRIILFPSDHDQTAPEQAGQVQCRVMDIGYEFPCTSSRKVEAHKLSIQMLITLSFRDGTFVCFYNASNPNYLVPLEQYQRSQKLKLYSNCLIKFYNDDEQYMYLGVEPNDPHLKINEWQNLKCRGLQDDQYALRGQKGQQSYNKFNLWDIRSIDGKSTEFENIPIQKYLPFAVCEKLSHRFTKALNRKEGFKMYFSEPVDSELYQDYYEKVIIGCDVGTIMKRYFILFISLDCHASTTEVSCKSFTKSN